jgi:hypothetical protein
MRLVNFRAEIAKRRKKLGFWRFRRLARFVQKTDRSVSYP